MRVGKRVIHLSISEMAGHGSFFFLALSYLENDFLNLRLYALSGKIPSAIFIQTLCHNCKFVPRTFTGISLSIIFQYYRERPLWIPIKWNALFLLINTVMAMFILKVLHEFYVYYIFILKFVHDIYDLLCISTTPRVSLHTYIHSYMFAHVYVCFC